MFSGIRRWWQLKTGQVDTPVVTDVPWWIVSLGVHLILLVAMAKILLPNNDSGRIRLVADSRDPISLVEPEPEIRFDEIRPEFVGEAMLDNLEFSMNAAPILEMKREDFLESIQPQTDIGDMMLDQSFELASADRIASVPIKGSVGNAVASASGAVDRVTEEIVMSLEQRNTLVIWLFDQSPSMMEQQAEIARRLETIYAELDKIANLGMYGDKRDDVPPLLTQVYSFGRRVDQMMRMPTDDFAEIQKAFSEIQRDDSGVEVVFSAVIDAATRYRSLRRINRLTNDRERNVMIIIVSDEAGDDTARLDECVQVCVNNEIPVYVIGVPAPFGRAITEVRWVDPDPNFDQEPQWTPVSQGPETMMPERLQLEYFTDNFQEFESIDSGFGPFGLTRLAYETGGIYFAVHPNRDLERAVRMNEIQGFTAYMRYFFDPEIMKRYRPDYVTSQAYMQKVGENACRQALVQGSQLSSIAEKRQPFAYFPRFDEADFTNRVSMAQRDAAILEPQIERIFQVLKTGEIDRSRELSPRWQAGFDLAYGRILAARVRVNSYNAMLAIAKTNLQFKNPRSNTWVLRPADSIETGSAAANMAELAKEYLNRVVAEHSGTPWAMRAQAELDTPIGWTWEETFTPPPDPNAPPPPPPKPRRDPPRL